MPAPERCPFCGDGIESDYSPQIAVWFCGTRSRDGEFARGDKCQVKTLTSRLSAAEALLRAVSSAAMPAKWNKERDEFFKEST